MTEIEVARIECDEGRPASLSGRGVEQRNAADEASNSKRMVHALVVW